MSMLFLKVVAYGEFYGTDNFNYLFTLLQKAICCSIGIITGCFKQFQPITCLASFLVGNACFRKKILLRLRRVSFFHIGADRSAGAKNLPAENIFFMFPTKQLIEFNDSQSEGKTFIENSIRLHTRPRSEFRSITHNVNKSRLPKFFILNF